MNNKTLFQRLNIFARLRELRRKAEQYESILDNLQGVRQALETQERANEVLRGNLADKEEQIQRLKSEYTQLTTRQSEQGTEALKAERLALFERVKPLMTQLPTLRDALEKGADIQSKDILAHFSELETVFQELGFEKIGEAGSETSFDPQRHRAVGSRAGDISAEQAVRVRYVGYAYEGSVLHKAEVTVL